MATYSKEQVSEYLQYIGFNAAKYAEAPSMSHLSGLIFKHLAFVPFECLSLHYSKTRRLSLDPEDLYKKVVGHGRGGYCMEVNAFFLVMLRSLGYTVLPTGARVSNATSGRPGNGFGGL